jgi:hypothetical protein
MRISWKTGTALFIVALAFGGGCAAGGAESASEDEALVMPEWHDGHGPAKGQGSPGAVDVTINVNEIGSNDTSHACGHHHPDGGVQGSPGDGDQSPPDPAAPPPAPATPPAPPAAPPDQPSPT